MRLSSTILLLPALAAAQDQIPLREQMQGWLNKAKSFLPTAITPVVTPAANSATAAATRAAAGAGGVGTGSKGGAATIVNKEVTPIRLTNWESLLAPKDDGPAQEWLIYVTGGNNTCYGLCKQSDKAWEDALPLFSADETSPSLGKLNCEANGLLCSILSAGAPSIWHWQVPAREPGQPKPKTVIHTTGVNTTTVDAETIYKIHSEKVWEKTPAYDGAFHPVDSMLAQYGLNVPVGYVLYGVGMVPSWLVMVGISFISRTVMSRRMGPPRPQVVPPTAGAAQ
ncbi:PTH2 family peptidyl-tRNA hydrolase [[Emmonsia] crescens]|uniref:PTH2 family peptidyl-tRNA hydrolase n=1 Tax=[Emmonsia] crescens TaxID=73230 RepID=A0A2B7ZGF5_9EURO|nr:PTH2 family peptidyl-tRNA hydrolase [Emmonsia crescens]